MTQYSPIYPTPTATIMKEIIDDDFKEEWGAQLIIDLHSLGSSKAEAEKRINTFLDWLDKASMAQNISYDSVDYDLYDANKIEAD